MDRRLRIGDDAVGSPAQLSATVVDTARGVVSWLVGGLSGLVDENTAERGAWEATRSDELRRSGRTP
jgi:hypothetical protein